jgi:HPt (histidine-containing phosphotransfer) domain-containing protein
VIEMTNLLPSQEQLETALKLARGVWQRSLIKSGYLIVGGSATCWSEEYKKSLFNLCDRLRKAGIEARAFVDRGSFTFYLVIGAEWVKLIDRVEAIMSPASVAYAQLRKKFSAEMEKELKKLKLRKRLRSLLAECKDALTSIGDYYGHSVRGYCNPQEAYKKSTSFVEEIEKVWSEMKDFVGVFLL